MAKLTLSSNVIFLIFSLTASAETIYQWSDPWGQIQYSTTPVPGAMVSDLTELPQSSPTTEQQKQDAMVRKLQKMQQLKLLRNQNKMEKLLLDEKMLQTRNYCRQLRIQIADLQARNLWHYPLIGLYYFPNYYGHLHIDLSKEYRNYCR
ncbi:DUF4124 domain-containing protein [Nitrosomonas marina]|uniref:DUF4124 domain-containing protein n=1 Tax=Nitrosomonas marina TaxID=917 RepID=A0A1H8I7Y1_9PROT|nr:DUF4124 domain-containing protein [Nitrosomonas marina]SEN64265.1 protein of unknown function [Nitrosomonas marina]